MKLRHELLVEYAHLAVENQRRRFQRSDRVGELSKTFRVVDVVAADEADARAVVLLLVQPGRWNGLARVGAIGMTVGSEDTARYYAGQMWLCSSLWVWENL